MSNYILISTSIFRHQLPDPSSLGCIPVPRCLGSSCLENLNLQLICSHCSIHKSILALIGHLIGILSCDWLTHLDIIFIMTRSGEVFAHNKLFRFLINLLQHTLDYQSINQSINQSIIIISDQTWSLLSSVLAVSPTNFLPHLSQWMQKTTQSD